MKLEGRACGKACQAALCYNCKGMDSTAPVCGAISTAPFTLRGPCAAHNNPLYPSNRPATTLVPTYASAISPASRSESSPDARSALRSLGRVGGDELRPSPRPRSAERDRLSRETSRGRRSWAGARGPDSSRPRETERGAASAVLVSAPPLSGEAGGGSLARSLAVAAWGRVSGRGPGNHRRANTHPSRPWSPESMQFKSEVCQPLDTEQPPPPQINPRLSPLLQVALDHAPHHQPARVLGQARCSALPAFSSPKPT